MFICRHIYLCKQLLPQINSCCQIVMQNNEMTSPWSNHCRTLVASRKTTARLLCLALILSPRTVPNVSVYGPDNHFQGQWLDVERCYLIFLHPVVCVSRSKCELKTGIFARRAMVDQARESLCYQRETSRFSMLDIEKIACSDLS